MPVNRDKSKGKKDKCLQTDNKGKKCNKPLTVNGQCPTHGPW